VAEADRALALSPNLALGYWRRATARIFSGRPQEGLADLQTSLRLDPRGANLAPRLTQMAVGYYFSRAYEETVGAAKCRSAPNRDPGEIGLRLLISPRKSARGRGPDRCRSGPLHTTHFAANSNTFPGFEVGVSLGRRNTPPSTAESRSSNTGAWGTWSIRSATASI
jgi:hypothetical protein